MAAEDVAEVEPLNARSTSQDIATISRVQEETPSSTPVELHSMPSNADNPSPFPQISETPTPPAEPSIRTEEVSPNEPTTSATITNVVSPVTIEPPPPTMTKSRTYSTAIGPSSDQPMPPVKDVEAGGPVLLITLLLTNGARHPFKLDGKYLAKRNVEVPENDPFNLSVYKLKELILREWRDEWEQKPTSPSSIRLISFGKLLEDKGVLSDLRLNHDAPNVVHMTVKPQDYVEDEDAKGAKSGYPVSGERHERSPGCRCVVM